MNRMITSILEIEFNASHHPLNILNKVRPLTSLTQALSIGLVRDINGLYISHQLHIHFFTDYIVFDMLTHYQIDAVNLMGDPQ